MATTPLRELWRLTAHARYFQQRGRIYAYHNQIGYLLAMSPDIVDLLEFHRGRARTPFEVDGRFGRHFGRTQLGEFLSVLEDHRLLVDADEDEDEVVWRMVPVRARWVVFHQPTVEDLTFWRALGGRPPESEVVPAWAARFWARVDGAATLSALVEGLEAEGVEMPSRAEVRDTIVGWVGSGRQALRFSKVPVRRYGAEWRWPPYLRSEMPFAPWSPGERLEVDPLEAEAEPISPPHDYYAEGVEDAESQFEEVETTLSHLLRRPHALLGGATYADRVVDALIERGMVGVGTRRVVEVGAGQGHFAAGVLKRLGERLPEIMAGLSYTIVDLSPALQARQRQTLREAGLEDRVVWRRANVEEAGWIEGLVDPGWRSGGVDRDGEGSEEVVEGAAVARGVDLLLCNEVIGDLTTVRLTRASLGLAEGAGGRLSSEGEAVVAEVKGLCEALGVSLEDAPESFFFNLGALRFLSRIKDLLAPGGSAWVTEYGDRVRYPSPASHLDHVEFSVHFGHMAAAARGLGLEAEVEDVQALIGLDQGGRALATTRSWFAAFRAMLAGFGVEIDKVAWTDRMLVEAMGEAVSMAHIGEVRFEAADQRCMGLLPHEFRALLLRVPGGVVGNVQGFGHRGRWKGRRP